MTRKLRFEQRGAWGVSDLAIHRTLRHVFIKSYWTRAWMLDGELAGLAGALGSQLSPVASVWLTMSDAVTRHPSLVVKEAKAVLDELMNDKLELRINCLEGDDAALRYAIFLGFKAEGASHAAFSRYGRRTMLRYVRETPELRRDFGAVFGIPMVYSPEVSL